MTPRPATIESLRERFNKSWVLDPETGCHLWIGQVTKQGGIYGRYYGRISFNSREYRAHRIVWFLETGEHPPDGVLVCHKCDMPLCVNRQHHFFGSHRDNALDMVAKGRNFPIPPSFNEQHHNVKLTNAEVADMRMKHATGLFTNRELGEMFRCSTGHVSKIVRGVLRPPEISAFGSGDPPALCDVP